MKSMTSRAQHSRTVVETKAGLVTTGHDLSAKAGVETLEAGGNAFDAAAAAIFASWVVEPESCGLGGIGRGMVYSADAGQVHVLGSTGKVPAAATPDMFELEAGLDPWGRWRKVRDDANMVGPKSAMVPGMLAGVCAVLDEFGSMPLDRLLAPAVSFARDGIAVDGYTALHISGNLPGLLKYPQTAQIFAPGGAPLRPGSMHQRGAGLVQSDLALSLERIGKEGPALFYGGGLAERIERYLAELGGILSAQDLASYRPNFRPPERTGSYRGLTFVWADGFFANLILNVLENFDLGSLELGGAEHFHLQIEATRYSVATLLRYLADPALHPSPLAALWSKEFAAEIADRIVGRKAAEKVEAVSPWAVETRLTGQAAPAEEARYARKAVDPGTSQVVVADRMGNVACFNITHSGPFGSMVTVPGTGILLNGAMASMDPEPGGAHSIHPNRWHLGFSAPVLALRDGQPHFAFSASGGRSVITCQVQVTCAMVDHGLTAQEAIEFPRMHCEAGNPRIDRRVGPSVIRELRAMGHRLEVVDETFYSAYFARPVCVEAVGGGNGFRSGISPIHRTAAAGVA